MKNLIKAQWFISRLLLLMLVFNIAIIVVSPNDQKGLWILMVLNLLFLIVIYRVRQSKLFPQYFVDTSNPDSWSIFRPSAFKYSSGAILENTVRRADLHVSIGNSQCSQPFNASLLTVKSKRNTTDKGHVPQTSTNNRPTNLILAKEEIVLNGEVAAKSIWQIDSNFIGFKTVNGHFDSQAFKTIAGKPNVKMIEIKLSSQRDLEHRAMISSSISKSKNTTTDRSIFQEPEYTTFYNSEGLIYFVETLRKLSGGKPIGIRLPIIEKRDFHEICYAIRKSQIIPDFIVVESSGLLTGDEHSDFHYNPEAQLYEVLLFVSQTLKEYVLNKEIKVIAAGKVRSGLEILKLIAAGADAVYTETAEFDIRKYSNIEEARFEYWSADLQNKLLKDFTRTMNVGGFRSVADITLANLIHRVDELLPVTTRKPVNKKMYLDFPELKYLVRTETAESRNVQSIFFEQKELV